MPKVRVGEPFRPNATDHNRFVDVANAFEQGRVLGGQSSPLTDLDVVFVENNSGGDLDRAAVLGIGGVVFTPTDNGNDFEAGRFIINGATPVVATHTGKFVVLLEPIKDGEIGRAAAGGVVPVQVDINATWHEFADVKAGTSELDSKPGGGTRILYQESGTGTKWCLVSFCTTPSVMCRFDLDSALATTDASKTADIDVCTIVGYNGQNITVTNQTASTNYVFEGGAGDYGQAYYDAVNDKWYIYQMEC